MPGLVGGQLLAEHELRRIRRKRETACMVKDDRLARKTATLGTSDASDDASDDASSALGIEFAVGAPFVTLNFDTQPRPSYAIVVAAPSKSPPSSGTLFCRPLFAGTLLGGGEDSQILGDFGLR